MGYQDVAYAHEELPGIIFRAALENWRKAILCGPEPNTCGACARYSGRIVALDGWCFRWERLAQYKDALDCFEPREGLACTWP